MRRDPELGRHRRSLTPQPRDNEWAQENGLVGRFVVMHSGNVGHAQDLDTLIRATTFLRDLDDLRAVIIGFGARHAEHVALAERLEANACASCPTSRASCSPQSLSSADVHFVGLGHGLSGYVVPSRLYGVLAVGRPVIAAADADSETARVVREAGCGLVDPARAGPTCSRGRSASRTRGEHDLAEMGRRGRAYVEAEADREVAIGRYRARARRGSRGDRPSRCSSGSRSPRSSGRTPRYPLAVWLLARVARRPVAAADWTPSVAVIVAAHDEEPVIERRIQNLLALDYPRDLLEIVVTSDASTDATEEIAERAGARVIRNPRGGKVAAQDRAVRETDSELVAFSDANATWAPDALRMLVAAVRRSRGRLRLRPAPARARRTARTRRALYWRYEMAVRAAESTARLGHRRQRRRSTPCDGPTTSRSTRASGTTSRCRT